MRTKLIIHKLALTLACAVWLAGCAVPPAAPNKPAVAAPATTPANFQGGTSGARSPVDTAIELTQKYADASEQLTMLRQEIQTLTMENEAFRAKISELGPKLQQAQKELGEANDLLMEMRLELNNWQNDVLGFRSEMRDADQAQLDALLKILMLLGGEITPSAPDTTDNQDNPVSDPDV